MAKASASALDLPSNAGQPLFSWEHLGYVCEFRKGANGLGLVSVEGDGMPIPLHEIVSNLSKAKRFAAEAITDLQAGRAPRRGIFQAVVHVRS